MIYQIHFTPSSGAHHHFLRCPVIPVNRLELESWSEAHRHRSSSVVNGAEPRHAEPRNWVAGSSWDTMGYHGILWDTGIGPTLIPWAILKHFEVSKILWIGQSPARCWQILLWSTISSSRTWSKFGGTGNSPDERTEIQTPHEGDIQIMGPNRSLNCRDPKKALSLCTIYIYYRYIHYIYYILYYIYYIYIRYIYIYYIDIYIYRYIYI